MKNKGVMISLAALVFIGMMITTGTHNFIEKNSAKGTELTSQVTEAAMDAAAEDKVTKGTAPEEMILAAGGGKVADEEGAFGDAPDGRQADKDLPDPAGSEMAYAFEEGAEADAMQDEEAAQAFDMRKSSSSAFSAEMDGASKAAAAELAEEPAAMALEEPRSYYVKRLQDLDSQIQKNKESQTWANVNGSVKSAAASELKLWDSELNDIYNAVLDRLGQEESEELVKEERAWLKERDSLAMDAAKKSAGGSSESIEYTISLTESTRQRAYELAERYAQVLEE